MPGEGLDSLRNQALAQACAFPSSFSAILSEIEICANNEGALLPTGGWMIRASRLKGVLPVCNATLVLREFRSVFRHLVRFYIHHMNISKNLQRRCHQIIGASSISHSGG